MLSSFIENDLIFQNQSGFKPVFLDISKAFDNVWYQGVILKLKQNGISENLLKIIEDFLSNRYQKVVLNGQSYLDFSELQ